MPAPEAAEAAVAPAAEGTPPAPPAPVEQPATAPADQAPAKPTRTDADLQKLRADDYTRKMQKLASVRRELGLDAGASEDELLTAVQALRHQAASPALDPGAEGITDPRYLELEQRATGRLWQAEETVHGPVAAAARELHAFMRRTSDPEAITEKMYEVLGRFSVDDAAAVLEGAGEASGPGEPPAIPESFGLPDSGPRTGGTAVAPQEVTDEFRNTGNFEGWLHRFRLPRP